MMQSAKCKVVKDYSAALTRTLLANLGTRKVEDKRSRTASTNIQFSNARMAQQSYATVTKMMPLNSNKIIFKKLDGIVTKAEEESGATRRSLEDLKE